MLQTILRQLYFCLCKPVPLECAVHVMHDASCVSLTHEYEEKDAAGTTVKKTVECHPFFDQKTLFHVIDVSTVLKEVYDDTYRLQLCHEFYDEIAKLLVNNENETANAVVWKAELYECETLKAARASISKNGKRKATESGAAAVNKFKAPKPGPPKAEKSEADKRAAPSGSRLHPEGECKYWCSFGNCNQGTNCRLKHDPDNAQKFPGAHTWTGR